jgi:hypothetical protein
VVEPNQLRILRGQFAIKGNCVGIVYRKLHSRIRRPSQDYRNSSVEGILIVVEGRDWARRHIENNALGLHNGPHFISSRK